jgi:hypothetical protein
LKGSQKSTGSQSGTGDSSREGQEIPQFEGLAELFAAANPKTEPDKALVTGYWFQVVRNEADLTGQSLNEELKHLGHGVLNITKALTSLMKRKPQLVIQIRKSGTSKQARKKYKLTDSGRREVERMLTSSSE